jgi:hypothetical protein
LSDAALKSPNSTSGPSLRSFLAGTAISLLLHMAVLLLAVVLFRGCQQGSPGNPGGEVFREVGLFPVDGTDDGTRDAGTLPGAGDADTTQVGENSPSPGQSDDTAVPDPQQSDSRLPTEVPDIGSLASGAQAADATGEDNQPFPGLIGPGTPLNGLAGGAASGSRSLIQPSQQGGARRIGGVGGPGETTFMNIVGQGKSFVYVIDTSSSMDGPRLRMARSQLKASLRLLQPNQQFAVILYSEYRERLKLRRQAEQPLYFATEVNKQLAAQEIDRIASDHGTDHKPALLEAFSLKPDVVYFLTDGDEPALTEADLRDIRHVAGAITVHVIRFGNGAYTDRSITWLQKLAAQCQGEYRELVAEP